MRKGFRKGNPANVKLFQPIGFTEERVNKQPSLFATLVEAIVGFFSFRELSLSLFEGKLQVRSSDTSDTSDKDSSSNKRTGISKPTIEENIEITIQPGDTYRVDFNLKAGWSGGVRPRPDAYTISGEITYQIEKTVHYKHVNIDVSIFPSLGTMLIGTLVGSFLGTIVHNIVPQIQQNGDVPTANLQIISLQIFANLILGFVVGITLMRKKDVQPFLTVEDFGEEYYWDFLLAMLVKDSIRKF
ncbi:MAG: hypothetical protein WBQ25_07520 [Nitrososphaeraceae archaeon]